MSDISLEHKHGGELLSLILQMVHTSILRLLEYYELVSLVVHTRLVAELEFQRHILKVL